MPGPRIVIIGAGISGILLGIKLRERGWNDFIILEKAEKLGGTWRDNVYPGVACDVAAHLYVYSFAPNPDWCTRYACGQDIWAYYNAVAEQFGVTRHIRTNKEVIRAEFGGAGWRVTTGDGEEMEADVVISATGRLHVPVLPDIAGRDTFAGPHFHTARWDRSFEPAGQRIGLIGTGSTSVQIVSALADTARKLTVFQRTPQWVYPVANAPIPWWKRLKFRMFPSLATKHYYELRDDTERRMRAAIGDEIARAERDRMCIDALGSVRDPELRRKLTPDYAVGCKRMVISGTFYDAIQKPSIDLETAGIARIEARGVVTEDGRLHELDALVFATGFDSQAYFRPMQLIGEDGITAEEIWRERAVTYQTVGIPHMPNFFMINGPYSPGGSASVVGIIEVQADYIMQLLERIDREGVLLCPDREASEAWLDGVRERAAKTVWGTGGCQSWYLDKTGTPTIDASLLSELAARMVRPDFTHYVERKLPRPADP